MFPINLSFPGGANGKEPTCQCRRHKRCGFNPWVRKILWMRKQQPTTVTLPGEAHGERSLAGYSPYDGKESGYNWSMCVCKQLEKTDFLLFWSGSIISIILLYKFFLFFTFKGILSYSIDTESFMLKAISTLFSVSFCFISFWSCINRCIIHLWLFKSSWRTDSYNYETVLYFWQYFFS